MDHALGMCREYLNDDLHYVLHRYKPKTDVCTWQIPERYHVKEAWLEIDGERITDFIENSLQLLSSSAEKD